MVNVVGKWKMFNNIVVGSFFVHFIGSCGCQKDPVVVVQQGSLRGSVSTLLDGSAYYSFKGIPYADAPTGSQRFRAPLPPRPWQGVYEAYEHGPVCTQYDASIQEYVEGSEKCLFINIYTRSLQPTAKKPVMVYIHGGSFSSGSGNSADGYGPEFLLPHDVVLVTMNYRLEVLGFLSLGTPEVPGNAGMKDQVFALRWIQRNIEQFGGDRNSVTIFGESSGSASVIYHMLSPMSKGLFHKAIAQSGVTLNDHAYGQHPRQRAIRLGKVLGKDTTSTTELLTFLRSVPAINLTRVTEATMTEDERNRGLPEHFVPIVEKKFPNVEAFLTEQPLDLLKAKKLNGVPLMIGYNTGEGILNVPGMLAKLNFTNENIQYLVPKEIAQLVTDDKEREYGERIRTFYVGDRDFTAADEQQIADFYSDLYFTYTIHRFTYFYSAICMPTYMYRFDLQSDLNVVKSLSGLSYLKGASHADDIFYLFYNIFNKDAYEQQEIAREYVHRMTKLWTNFAKTNNPTPDNSLGVKWKKYRGNTKSFLNLKDQMVMERYADQAKVEFWDRLYAETDLLNIAEGIK